MCAWCEIEKNVCVCVCARVCLYQVPPLLNVQRPGISATFACNSSRAIYIGIKPALFAAVIDSRSLQLSMRLCSYSASSFIGARPLSFIYCSLRLFMLASLFLHSHTRSLSQATIDGNLSRLSPSSPAAASADATAPVSAAVFSFESPLPASPASSTRSAASRVSSASPPSSSNIDDENVRIPCPPTQLAPSDHPMLTHLISYRKSCGTFSIHTVRVLFSRLFVRLCCCLTRASLEGDPARFASWKYNALRCVRWILGTASVSEKCSVAELFATKWDIIVGWLQRPDGHGTFAWCVTSVASSCLCPCLYVLCMQASCLRITGKFIPSVVCSILSPWQPPILHAF